METAKVDIRKLQLLNDRINQCIDALNQVRLSVHGLSQTSGAAPGISFGGLGAVPGFIPGLSHTSSVAGGIPGVTGIPGVFPGNIGAGTMGFPGITPGLTPLFGLSHTSAESLENYTRPTWADPYLAARVAQTFPYIQFAVPPVVSLY